jgi:hypothetical protein
MLAATAKEAVADAEITQEEVAETSTCTPGRWV